MNARAVYLRSFLAALIAVVFAESAFAQGTINFANLVVVGGVRIVDAPVRFFNDGLVSGSAYVAQLYAGPTATSLLPLGVPAPFLSGANAGYFSGGIRTVDFVPPGQFVFVEVRAWWTEQAPTYEVAGVRGASPGMLIPTGGLNGSPPADMIGLQPFCIGGIGGDTCIPEPRTLALLFLGGVFLAARFLRRR